jgi:putative ABC transport system permease protein
MTQWLSTFAYQVEIDFTLFIIAALAAASVAFLTISYQAIRAAHANPAQVLKTE